ncbi:MAG: hypothetical protein FJZ67_09775 [Bacteroidetes bacterium]|nr:hypothetical protein [Bacteroidota bacterium]
MASNEPFDSFIMELNELKNLLNYPDQLKIEVEKLRSDNTQSEEIKGFISLYDSFDGDTLKILNYLKETESSIKNVIPKKRKSISILKYAAVFAVIVGITIFIYTTSRKNNKISEQKIISKNLYKDPGIPIYMSEETKINWGELMFAIENESPQKAVQVWQKIENVAPKNDTVLYYGGIVHRNNLMKNKALRYFKENLKTESIFHEQSLYFIAINEWEIGKVSRAKRNLLKLKNAENLDIRQAVRFNLKELEKENP